MRFESGVMFRLIIRLRSRPSSSSGCVEMVG